MANDLFGYDELSPLEIELLTQRPDDITAMLAGSLRFRRERMREAERELVDRFLRERDKRDRKPRAPMTDAERKRRRTVSKPARRRTPR